MSANPIQELRDGLAYVEAELAAIHSAAEGRAFNDGEQARWDEGKEYLAQTRKQVADLEERAAMVAAFDAGKTTPGDAGSRMADKSFTFHRDSDPAMDVAEDRSATPAKINDAILRSLSERDTDDTQVRALLKKHGRNTDWSRNLLARSSDIYADAFSKVFVGRDMLLTSEERVALSVGTNANGGFLVPTHLDPTVILSNDGSANALRPISRVVTLTDGDTWNGVSSAGVTASFDAELAEVSDDSPTFSQPSIAVHKAQAFAHASVEALQDIAGLGSEVLMMFADARDRLEGSMHCTGTGTAQPTGIFTAIDASGNETQTTTAATIGLVDLQATRRAVGQRFRGRSTWVMHPEWADEIKRLGAALSASYSTDLTQSNTDRLLGRPVVETDDAPNTSTTTALDDRAVLGDFSNFVIVDKPGSLAVHFIPPGVLQNTSNNLPDGRVGWYAYWRTGSDSVNDAAFQLLMDKTSA